MPIILIQTIKKRNMEYLGDVLNHEIYMLLQQIMMGKVPPFPWLLVRDAMDERKNRGYIISGSGPESPPLRNCSTYPITKRSTGSWRPANGGKRHLKKKKKKKYNSYKIVVATLTLVLNITNALVPILFAIFIAKKFDWFSC